MSDFSRFFTLSNDLCCVIDEAGAFKHVNRTFLHGLGYTTKEVIDHIFFELVHPEDLSRTQLEYEKVKKGKKNNVIENRIRTKTGNYKWVSWSSIAYDRKGFFYAACQDVTELKQLQEELFRIKGDKQLAIARAVMKTQDRERETISEELHDNVNQILTSVKLNIEYCQDICTSGSHLLKKSTVLLQSAIDEIRALCNKLSTKQLEFNSLSSSIQHLIDNFSVSKKFVVRFSSDRISDNGINKDVKLNIYRILQEQFTNIAKYSNADKVQVNLFQDGEFLRLEIKDNGKGFDARDSKVGNGLMNMRARTEGLNGRFNIESAPGSGCSLTASFPVAHV
jgi:PAS domain S-box-containing protein